MMRNRQSVFLEFDQLLNLLFPSNSPQSDLWKSAPFANAFQTFCRDAVAVVPPKDLRLHAVENWLTKRRLSTNPRLSDSLKELLNANFPQQN